METRLRWVQTILGLVVVYYLIFAICSGFRIATYLNSVALITWLVSEYLRVRKKRIELAAWIVIAVSTFVISGTAMIDGQASAYSLWFFPVVPLIAGQILGNRAVLIAGAGSFVAAGAVMVSERWVSVVREYPESMEDLVVLRLCVLLVACGVSISAKRTFRVQSEQLDRQARELNTHRLERDEARRSASVFLSSMSGHVRDPMAQLVTKTLRIEQGEQGEHAHLARDAASCATQVSRLVHDILDLSDLENARLVLRPTTFMLGDLIAQLRDWFDEQPNPGVKLRIDGPQRAVELTMDRCRLRQICIRLMDNALKFSQAKALLICFALSEDGQDLVLRVQDDGVGIGSERQKQVMERFAFYCDTQANQDKGAGISLVLVRQLARAMGGEVSFEPPPQGRGTSVLVQLRAIGGSCAIAA